MASNFASRSSLSQFGLLDPQPVSAIFLEIDERLRVRIKSRIDIRMVIGAIEIRQSISHSFGRFNE